MDTAAAKVPEVKASDAPKNSSGERRSSGHRGTLIPPAELGRRPSLLLGDGENRKLRPGEVVEEKKERKSSIFSKALEGKSNEESTPLRDIGEVGPPQFVDMYECYSAVEGEIGYISAQVQGIPAPTFKFYYKGVTPLIEGVRYKYHTDGETNTVTLCMRNIKSSDEGKYKIVFTNCHGTVSDETQLYVSKPGVTDFRTLLRKSKYAKWGKAKGDPKWGDLKGVQKAQNEFSSPLKDQTVKEGKDKKVEFVAKFTKQNAKSKWYFRKEELFMGVKYKFRNDGDTYQLTVLNPKLGDSGKYMIDIGGVQSSALLNVEAPDPSYSFIQPLKKKHDGYTKHELTLECKVSDPIAIVSWYKGDKKLSNDDKYLIDKDLAGVCILQIKSCDLDDTGDFRCQLERQPDKTETKVKVAEYPYKFVKKLKSQQNVEKDTVTLACELDDPIGEVKWFKGGKEIKPDGDRIQVVKDGRKRKLIIKDATLSDADQYSCTSNADNTKADLMINKQNKFNKELKDTIAVEREKLVLDIELEDEKAPAEWKLNGKNIKPSNRIQIKNLGGGKHQLVIDGLKMADAGEISVESGKLKSSCKLTVGKGETKPQITAPKEIEGSVGVPIVFEVPYKIDGKKQTPIEALLLKDGKPLSPNDFEVQVKDDKAIFTIKKPTRDQSGLHQIKLSNGQGDDVKDIKISVQDVPNAPQDVNVRDVFEKSCIVDWKSPKENGGTPIQKYIIERQDVSSKGKWENAGEVSADKPSTFKVEDLTPNKQYKFRIRAVNKVGPSEPAEFKNNVLAKNPWDEPSKPNNLEVTDWDKDHAKLKWTRPDKDGGAEITEYEVEVKEKQSKEWVKKKRVPASETTATVDDLKECKEYEFRVRAINKAGAGEPSNATKPIVAKCRFVKPFITGDQLKNIVIKNGQQFKYEIRYGGEPEPEVKWEKDANILTSDDRIKIEKSGGKTILTVRNAVRGDSGKYKLILTNSSGTIDSTGEVVVLGKPSAPKGPLEVTDIIENGCKIKWKKPDDNGGVPIKQYKIEKLDTKSDKWSFVTNVPNVDKTEFPVTGLTYGPEYKFRVSAINDEGESDALVTEHSTITKKPETKIVGEGLKDTVAVEREKLVLDIELDDEKAPAEWKLNGKNIKPSNRIEIKNLGGGKHQLVINGLQMADSGEISVESGKLKSSCKLTVEKGETKPQITAPKEIEGSVGVPIVFEVPYKIDGKKQTPIEALLLKDGKPLSPNDFEVQVKDDKAIFTIKKPTRDQSGLHQIKLSNGQGDDVKDIKISVQDVPNAPQDVNVRDVFEKSCIVDWKSPKENGGTPIQKYIIERQDVSSKGKWENAGEVSADKPSTFKVEDLTPNKQYKFRVRAVNKVGPSEPAEFKNNVLAKNPWDEPSKPNNLEVTDWDKDHAKLKWTRPDKDGGAEITEYEVEVKEKQSKEWVKKKRVPASETTATVDDLKECKEYEFRVRAINKAGAGEPSDATKPIVAKCRFVKPFITGDQLKNIVIKNGQQFKHEIRYGGEPEPEVKWEKDANVLTSDDRIKIEKSGGKTILTVRNAVRGDSGKYKLILTNSSGTIDSTGEVVVLGKPSAPKGPLEVTDIIENGCKIKWKKPDDNGGVPIKQYKIEKLDTKSDKWSFVTNVPNDDKMEFPVTGLTYGPEYKFRVSAINDEGESDALVTEHSTITKKPETKIVGEGLKDTVAVEREKLVLDIELDDEKAPAEWKLNGKNIKPSNRIEIKNLGGGKHQLVINGLQMADAGEISVESGKLKSSCKLTVEKGETKPQITAPKEIEGSVGVPIVFEVPYKIDGKKQTPIEALLLKDGKPLSPNDFEVQVKDDKAIFTIKKPTRDQSGLHQIKLSNGQGDDVKDIKISVQDVPNAPQDVNVRDVFEKSCIVDWKSPKENGGTPIQKYIIERQDILSKGKWENAGEVSADKPSTFKVEDLTPNKQYKFRIRAVNKVGPSEPAEFKNNVLAKNPWDEPSKPNNLEVTDWDKDHAKLKWTRPDKDGGAEITEYEVEVREKQSKEWVKRKRVPASETTATVDDLKECKEYEFRVRAINKAGAGEPSDATKPIVAKCRFVKPFITGDQLKNIVIKNGQQIKYEIRYGGEPEPEVKWEKDANVLASDDRIKIEKSGGKTILTVRNAVRGDSGKYKLILTNSSGTNDSTGEVIVLGKPSAPSGPLEVTDIIEDGCKLKWKKPADNGGGPIKQYKIEKLDTKSNKWSFVTNVIVDKTKYTVTGLTYGPEYKFRVSAINDEGESDVLVTENWTITKKAETEIVEYKTDAGAEVGVETCTTEKREHRGDIELTTKTTVTTTTTKNQIQDGNRTRTETVKRIVTRTEREQEFEEYYEEEEEEEGEDQ